MRTLTYVVVVALLVGCSGVAPSTPTGTPTPTAVASTASPTAVSTPPATPLVSPTTTPPVTPPPTATLAPATPAATAAGDLDNLLVQLEQTHPEPFHGISREEWVGELEALKVALPGLTPFEAQVELQRVVTLLSLNGRDGHQFALPLDDAPALPIATYEFVEGVFITDALAPHKDLVGRQIVALNGRAIEDVLAALEPLIPRDGPATVPAFRPIYFPRTSVLTGLGLIDGGPVPITVRDSGGEEMTVDLEPVPFGAYAALVGNTGVGLPPNGTLYLRDPGEVFWWQELPESNSLYVRYRQIGTIQSDEIAAVEDLIAAARVEQVIVDLRQNPGGDNNRYVQFLFVLRDYATAHPGRLVVLTDRRTFSAASNLSTEIEQQTDATFAGEPMGGGLNFWTDDRQVQLLNYPVPMWVGVSTRYWQKSTPDDPRLTIEPDMPFEVTAADYFAGVDPVMEAITSR